MLTRSVPITRRIVRLCSAQNRNLEALVQDAGFTMADWSRWEINGKIPKVAVTRLAAKLDVEPSQLNKNLIDQVEDALDGFLEFLRSTYGASERDVGRIFTNKQEVLISASYRSFGAGIAIADSLYYALLKDEKINRPSKAAMNEYVALEDEWNNNDLG